MSTRSNDGVAAASGPFGFSITNYVVIAAGLLAVAGGYVLLSRGSITAAPVLLVLGYMVLLPIGILLGWRSLKDGTEKGE